MNHTSLVWDRVGVCSWLFLECGIEILQLQELKMWLHMYPLLFTSGYSTDTSVLSAEGITGRVLLILTGVIVLLVWVVIPFLLLG